MRLKDEAMKKSLHLMVYGSWSRGEATEKSDIDIFVINTESSLLKSLRLGFISMKYRLLALFTPLSVDIYVIDRLDYLRWRKKTKPKENPIILNDPTEVIRDIYEGRETKLEDFMDALKRLYKG
ncbi:MAG: nucleotidyltransferase domain-containing protein [Infirmifilum sp.]